MIVCPFCGEPDFDALGLKLHLTRGHCAPYDNLCQTCGGSGYVAHKQFIDDGYGEVDSCPTCNAAPVQEPKAQP